MRSQSTEARRSRLWAWLGGADDAGATRDVVTDYQDTLLQVELLLTPPQQDDGPGTLEVGANERHEVVVNLPRDMTGHIVFNPDQARHLAAILVRQATAAEQAAVGQRPPMDMDAARKAMGLPDLVPLGNGLQRVGGHVYDEHGTSDCANGCGCWAGPSRSGGPDGVDPFGACPNAGDRKGR